MKLNPEALRALRIKDGYSIAGFAQRVGITPGHLSNVEAGRRGVSPAIAKRIADTLVVPLSALLFSDNERAA